MEPFTPCERQRWLRRLKFGPRMTRVELAEAVRGLLYQKENNMKFINEVRIVGRACGDPEQKGKGPCRFRLAMGGGKSKTGKEYPTEFFSVICWDTKEAAKVSKSARLEISGRLHDSTWTDKNGVRHYGTDIVADSIIAADATNPEEGQPSQPAANIHGVETSNEDVPF
jgi:single-strand DNA-binding protein